MNKITVITICYNNLEDLISTCKSVDTQQSHPFEHWIIDGSSDKKIETFLTHNSQPSYRYWLCERDKGIADAFNKGILRAKGDILVMLNSGDCFFDDTTIHLVSGAFFNDANLMWLHGKYKILRGGQWVIIGKPFMKSKLYRGMRSVCHQTMFVKKTLHDKYGLYNVEEKIGMDYDFLCRIASEKNTLINQPMAVFAPEGTSSNNYFASLKDARRIYEKYYGKSYKLIFWQMRLRALRIILDSPVGKFLYNIKTKLGLENA